VNLESMYFNTIAQMFGDEIVNCLVGGAAILLLVELFAHLLRREQSGVRFALWFAGLVAIAGMPFVPTVTGWLHSPFRIAAANHGAAATFVLPGAWALYLFTAWLIIGAVALMRIAAGFRKVYELRRRSSVVQVSTLAPEVQETLTQFMRGRNLAILESDEIQSPTAIGLLSPAILLPRRLKDELSGDELRQIFLHELSHLLRWDDWTNLLQKIVKALFFFHPAVWRVERQISLEREMACDEAVLAHTGNARAYANCLVLLAERSFLRRTIMLAQAAVSRVEQTSLRVTRILSGGRRHSTGVRMVIAPAFIAFLVISLMSVERMPRLVAFESAEIAPQLAIAHISPVSGPPVISASFPNARPPVQSAVDGALAGRRKIADHVSKPMSTPYGPLTDLPVVQARLPVNRNAQGAAEIAGFQPCEFLLVVVENNSNGSAVSDVWQIQMWHITILRTVRNSAPQIIPQKIT
jgi:beta-lactamase regulating signal transducer with metallopeptidase domain